MAKHKLFISILISYSDILIFLSAFQLFLRIYVKMIIEEVKNEVKIWQFQSINTLKMN